MEIYHKQIYIPIYVRGEVEKKERLQDLDYVGCRRVSRASVCQDYLSPWNFCMLPIDGLRWVGNCSTGGKLIDGCV